MKWILAVIPALFLLGCGCFTCTKVVPYRTTAIVAPPPPPPPYGAITIVDEAPIDVTTTTIQYF